MGAASNVFSTMLMQKGQQIRQQQQQDFESRAHQHEWATNYLTAMSQNPLLDDVAREQYLRQLAEVGSMPIPKFDVQKVVKKFTDPIDDYHTRHGAMVAQAFPTSDQQADPVQQALQSSPSPQGASQNSQALQFPQMPPQAPPQGASPAPQGAPQQALQAPPMPPAPGGDQGAPMSENMPNGQPAMNAAYPPFMDPMRKVKIDTAEFKAKADAQQQAEMERMQAVSAFNKAQEKQAVFERIQDLKKEIDPETGKSVWDGLSANERANVEIDAKRIIQPRLAASGAGAHVVNGFLVNDKGEVLFAAPPGSSEKNVPVDQQAFKGYLDKAKGDPVKAYQMMEADKERNKPAEEGTWSVQEDADGKPVLFNSKSAAVRPITGVQKSGTKARLDAATEKSIAPARDALDYAHNYLQSENFTGSGDEALQEKFFELAKPTTGFRMTQPQMDMLQKSRGWTQGVVAQVRHATTGTWFDNQQRQQIVNTMEQLANSKMALAKLNGPGAPPNPPAQQYKVGDMVQYQGKPHKVTGVDPNSGKLTLAP